MRISKVISFFLIFGVFATGAFGLYAAKNTFVVENPNAAFFEPVVYLAGADLNPNPKEAVAPEPETRIKVLPNDVGYLNVRAQGTVQSAKIGKVNPGDEFEYTEAKNNWYRIMLSAEEAGWVFGQYVEEITAQEEEE
jgi:hypothetical protein